MAHEIMSDDAVIYSRATPWHGFGVRLPADADSDTLKREVFPWSAVRCGVTVDTVGGLPLPETEYTGLRRSDNGALLSIVPESYGVVQYADALALLDAASKDGTTRYITAGTLNGGRRAWALADLPSEEIEVAGSPLIPYLLLSTSHDLTRALRVMFTSVYVVCANTEGAALSVAGATPGRRKHLPNVLTLKHTRNANNKVFDAARVIAQARVYFGAFNATALRFANERITRQAVEDIVSKLFPLPLANKLTRIAPEDSAAAVAQRTVVDLFSGRRPHPASGNAPGTKWAALQAVTEYVDHQQRRRGPESRFDAIMFGGGAAIRQAAVTLLLAA
jgi:phage/plasmid-like protein (TIGR03299 family)